LEDRHQTPKTNNGTHIKIQKNNKRKTQIKWENKSGEKENPQIGKVCTERHTQTEIYRE